MPLNTPRSEDCCACCMPMHDTGVDEAMLGLVRAAMRGLEPPGHHTKVYKDECMFTFDTPESPGGLFINLRTFQV